MAEKEPTNDKELLEETFRLIQEGNNRTDENDHWKAADCFAQAQAHLSQLAADHASDDRKRRDEEQQKIAGLYRQQSVEYLKRGRKSLVRALENDTAQDGPILDLDLDDDDDEQQQQATPTCISKLLHNLSEEDAAHRLQLFGRLFAKEMSDADFETVEEQASSLEQRLARLGQTLPRAAQSEAERLRELNRGLARLGLQQVGDPAVHQRSGRLFGLLDGDGGAAAATTTTPNKSEFEQVADIIAQARDEVAVNGGGGGGGSDAALAEAAAAGNIPEAPADALLEDLLEDDAAGSGDSVVEDDDDDDDEHAFSNLDDDDDEEDDADLTPELCRDILNKLAAAQASLSELVALFGEDADGDVAIEFDQARGKKVLRDTRLLLRQVAQKWAES